MSFLNPVNEPVLRFSSTDADAPQINYNARVAGDVKAVLKACLVTGYGATASAGWAIVNEVNHVAEFVSPSAAMSDYRLGIDDSLTTKTDWYYQYQDVRINPSYNAPVKAFTNVVKTHPSNGWELLATEQGIIFIELVQHSGANKLSARITYWGRVKSALTDASGRNIIYFNVGHDSNLSYPHYFYESGIYTHTMLASYTSANITSATKDVLSLRAYTLDLSNVDLVGSIYITNTAKQLLLGEVPGILSKIKNAESGLYGFSEQLLDSRSVLSVCAGYSSTVAAQYNPNSRTFLIRADYWEY